MDNARRDAMMRYAWSTALSWLIIACVIGTVIKLALDAGA